MKPWSNRKVASSAGYLAVIGIGLLPAYWPLALVCLFVALVMAVVFRKQVKRPSQLRGERLRCNGLRAVMCGDFRTQLRDNRSCVATKLC